MMLLVLCPLSYDVIGYEDLKCHWCISIRLLPQFDSCLLQVKLLVVLSFSHTVKPLLSRHLWDLPKCPFNRGCPLNRGCKNCVMFVNDQHSTVTLYCDKVACC